MNDIMGARPIFSRRQWSRGWCGFTLVELMLVMAMISTLAMISVPQYFDAVRQAKVAKAIGDIAVIGRQIQLFYLEKSRFPNSLAEVEFQDYPDPYGNAYEYLNIADQDLPLGLGFGRMRIDRFQVPINSDFDLYSMGEDGLSLPLLIAPVSEDDIIRGSNGGFIGLASEY